MKKLVPILIAIMLLLSACGKEAPAVQPLPARETPDLAAEVITDTQTESGGTPTEENALPEQSGLSSAGPDEKPDEYMASLESRAEQIGTALNEAMTQMEMTSTAAELYTLWDDALNYLWAELKALMPEDEFSKLLDEQLVWIAEKEEALAETGRQFEGGTAYSMAISIQGAQITQERVYELYELLKQAKTK